MEPDPRLLKMGLIDTEGLGEEVLEGCGGGVAARILGPETNMVILYRHQMLSARFLREL